MNIVAKFDKVSFEQFKKDTKKCFGENYPEELIIEAYNVNLQLPTRATRGSAGYDFKIPFDIFWEPKETFIIPTGIRVHMNTNWVLKIYPRSSLGFKYRMELDNTTGIIDSDYYYSKNEGHILAKITNNTKEEKTLILHPGDAFIQGIFCHYGITEDDNVTEVRNGGFGSTNK